jgi:predicted transcriptional regulator
MANVTLKIDDELLAKARWLASRRKTSLNAIVKQKLEEFVATDLRREATLKGLDEFYARSRARLGKRTWSRDELHER